MSEPMMGHADVDGDDHSQAVEQREAGDGEGAETVDRGETGGGERLADPEGYRARGSTLGTLSFGQRPDPVSITVRPWACVSGLRATRPSGRSPRWR
jgi:hypothetical protein